MEDKMSSGHLGMEVSSIPFPYHVWDSGCISCLYSMFPLYIERFKEGEIRRKWKRKKNRRRKRRKKRKRKKIYLRSKATPTLWNFTGTPSILLQVLTSSLLQVLFLPFHDSLLKVFQQALAPPISKEPFNYSISSSPTFTAKKYVIFNREI